MDAERTCKGPCGRTLPSTEENFFFRKSSNNGKSYPSSYCKTCEREKAAKSRRDRYATSGGKVAIDSQTAAYRAKPEKAKAISDHLKWMYANDAEYRAERKANASAWKSANRDQNSVNKARWYQTEKARLMSEWNARYKSEPEFRLRNNFRRAVWESMKANGGSKGGRSILKHLPYSMVELRAHLESLWEPWMNWSNYGPCRKDLRTWQIDHLIPQINLPFSDFSEPNFLACWALSNLRPLESTLNLSKGCRTPSSLLSHNSL